MLDVALMVGTTMLAMLLVIVTSRTLAGLEAKWIHHYSFTDEATERDNPAVLIRLAGMIAGVLWCVFSFYKPTGFGFVADLALVVQVFAAAFVCLAASRYVNDFGILFGVQNTRQVVEKRNVAVAVVEACTYFGTGFVFVGSLSQPNYNGFVFYLAWFVVGQVFFIALAHLYSIFVPKVFSEIEKGNVACGISLGGFLASGGLVVSSLIAKPSAGWTTDLVNIGIAVLAWLVVLFVINLVIDRVVVKRHSMRKEIIDDQNWGVALVQAAIMLSVSSAFAYIHI